MGIKTCTQHHKAFMFAKPDHASTASATRLPSVQNSGRLSKCKAEVTAGKKLITGIPYERRLRTSVPRRPGESVSRPCRACGIAIWLFAVEDSPCAVLIKNLQQPTDRAS